MKKTQYIIVGNATKVDGIITTQVLKDGTKITQLYAVKHQDLNGDHFHSFGKRSSEITYRGTVYKGVIKGGKIDKFTVDGHDIDRSLNRTLVDMTLYRRGIAYIEGMEKLLCKMENRPYRNIFYNGD